MKNLYFISLFILTSFSYRSQVNTESIDKKVSQINVILESLPKTNISGKGNNQYQSKYKLTFSSIDNKLTLSDTRYNAQSDEKRPEYSINEFYLNDLHKDGIVVRSLNNDENLSLQIFTSNNANKRKDCNRSWS